MGPRRKVALPRRCVLAWLVFAGAAACSWGSPGYLPCIGPASLRFQPIPLPAPKFELPKPPPPPETSATPSVSPLPPAPPVVSVATNAPLPQPPPAVQTNNIPDAAPQDSVVSPQMLLQFFNKGTNGTSAGVIMPLDFTPPKVAPPAPAPAPSKAEYTTTP